MSITAEVQSHFAMLWEAVKDVAEETMEYSKNEGKWTDSVKLAQRAKITNIRPDLIHPLDCSICKGWTED